MRRSLVAGIVALAPWPLLAGPLPPCDQPPLPGYSAAGGPPNAQVWTGDQLGTENWQPAACLGWAGQTKLVAAVASSFRSSENVFERGFAIDAWPRLQYWS